MEHMLPNGLRYYTKPTNTTFAEVSLLVPCGENHEDQTNPESAHACEHFACAFNGGFDKPYGFLNLRTKYGVSYVIHTYEDYTIYRILNIPTPAITKVCEFLAGIFVLNKPTHAKALQEIAIIHSEINNGDDKSRLYYKYLDWIRHQNGKPTRPFLNKDNDTGLTPEKVYQFHSIFYKPSSSFLLIRRNDKDGMYWDREISRVMTRNETLVIPGRHFIRNECISCKMIEGTWVIPSDVCWGAIGVFFNGEPERSEILARSMIASNTRLTGTTDPRVMSITDYLRTSKGLTYSTRGKIVRMNDQGTKGVLSVIVFILNRHLTRKEIQECIQIVTAKIGKLPSRGDLSGMIAKSVSNMKSFDAEFLLDRANIPFVKEMKWDMIHKAHSNYDPSRDRMGSVFSCPV